MKSFLDKFWADDEEWKEKAKKADFINSLPPLWQVILIGLIALVPRLYFIFFVSDPQNPGAGWYGDTYHHWQIGYFTKEVGLSHGFLRLWDLKGMEYFWGLLHPLLLVSIFTLSGSIDILILRLLSVLAGIGVIIMIYLLGRRYFNPGVGLAGALFASLNPLNIFNDTTGMLEFLGILPLLLGIYFWPKRPLLTGLFLGLALLARAEAWLFSLGLMTIFLFLTRTYFDRKLNLISGFGGITFFYFAYLKFYTGNLIYPFWWNFLAGALGAWQTRPEFTPEQIEARYYLIGLALLAATSLILILLKKPRGTFLLLFGFGSWLFVGVFIGLTAYLKSYEPWFWMIRFFAFPYLFLGLLLAIFLLFIAPKVLPIFSRLKLGWLMVFLILVFSQIIWRPILTKFSETEKTWQYKKNLAQEVAGLYKGGTILIPEYEPDFTYALVRFGKISGKNIQGQMYTPFAYKPFTEYLNPFQNWPEDRQLIDRWLEKENIKLVMVDVQREPFKEMIKRESEKFKFLKSLTNSPYNLYQVR